MGHRRRIALVALAVVVLFLGLTARLFVWPPTDRPTRVDAIVSTGGDPGQRRAHAAVALAAKGYAPVVVVSLGGYRVPCPRPPRRVRVLCFHPDPVDTRGEAEYATALARKNHWSSLMVVPERSQSTRARLLFRRCTAARLVVVPVQDGLLHLPWDVAYEWGALAKAIVLKRSC
ncbi:MAG: YdcF family protein [Acidobacteriota bacterium]|nr:YdcF family protein [Acidobacteriota bacterium]